MLDNLSKAFPKKTETELLHIIKKSYINLSDVFLESLKSMTSSLEDIQNRFQIHNLSLLDTYFQEKRSCIILTAHYCNWELIPHGLLQSQFKVCALYKPLRNTITDKYVSRKRKQHGLHLFPMAKAGYMVKNNLNHPSLFMFIGDQSPGNVEKAIWTTFLNRKTPVLPGADQIAIKFNIPVFYLSVNRVFRGKYEAELIPLADNPNSCETGYIAHLYMKKLEEILISNPENWLWTHRRWKHAKD
jgi:KDO2-lipid IV(A) lauroyltransferase